MKKLLLVLLVSPFLYFSQAPSNYYDAATGLTGYALKSKLHEIISSKPYSYNYSELPDLYAITDLDHYYENDNTLLDIYSENPSSAESYTYNVQSLTGSASGEGQGYNREHGMPQSTFYGIYPMYSDLEYVIPADAYINQRRSNYPYANNDGRSYNFSNGSRIGRCTISGYTANTYEPIDEFKGDVARYLLYFVVRYEGSLNLFNHDLSTSPLDGSEEKGYEDWYINMLKEWNALDPVSQREIDRNNAIYSLQKTRNPFIDHPEYVNLIWSQTPDAVPPTAPSSVNATSRGESYITLSWTPSASTDVLGYRIYMNGNYLGYSKTNTFTADRLTANTVYNFSVRTYDNAYLESSDSPTVSASTTTADALAKDLMITKYIEGSDNNRALEITNKSGHPIDLSNYYLNIQFRGANNTYYLAASYKLEGSIASGESKVIINAKSNFAGFGVDEADFITSSSPMNYSGSQYIELSYGRKYIKTVSTKNYGMAYNTVDAVGYRDLTNSLGNVTLYRNTNVSDPNTTFTPSEWTQYPQNYTVGLGKDAALATSEVKIITNVFIYPNPATDRLFFTGKDFESNGYVIYDYSGKLVQKSDEIIKGNSGIEINMLPSGYYIIRTDAGSFKFIKK